MHHNQIFKSSLRDNSRYVAKVLLKMELTILYNFSQTFNKCQRNYSVIEEAPALLLALQRFEVYLGGSDAPILVYTDHNPLVFLNHMSNTNQHLMRWSLIVQEYHLDICHKKGADNIIADALSRVHTLDGYWVFCTFVLITNGWL